MTRPRLVPRRKLFASLGPCVLFLLLLAPEVRAACDPLDYACQIKALAARTSAASKTSESVESVLNKLKSSASSVQTDFVKVQSEVQDFADDASAVLDAFETASATINSEAMQLSDELLRRINDGRQVIDYTLSQDRNAYLDFVGTDGCSQTCVGFRTQLVDLIVNHEKTSESIFEALGVLIVLNGGEPLPFDANPLDLSPMTDVLERAPGFLLFPLHQALIAVGATSSTGAGGLCLGDPACLGLESLNELLETLSESLRKMIDNVETKDVAGRAWFGASQSDLANPCLTIFKSDQSENDFITAAWISQLVGQILSSAGELITAWGMSEVEIKGGVSVALTLQVNSDRKALRALGHVFNKLGKIGNKLGEFLQKKIMNCRAVLNESLALCFLSTDPSTSKDRLEDCQQRVRQGEVFGFN